MGDMVEFLGAEFRVADKIGVMPTMEFARLQKKIESGEVKKDGHAELRAMLSLLEIVEGVLAPEEIERFEEHARQTRADMEDLNDLVKRAVKQSQGRPTGRSSDSSDGPRIIKPSSTGDSSSPATEPESDAEAVIREFNGKGRPDLARVVRLRQEALTG